MASVVRVRALSRRYGRHWALRDVDLTVDAGEAVLLLGANGAGKSTLLSMLATVLRPTSGELHLFGRPIRERIEEIRAQMAYLPHATMLDDALTARENLEFYAELYGVDEATQAVNNGLNTMGLGERGDDRVGGFSRGMRQRLSLARALLHDPKLLVLDEPFTGLDAAGCHQLGEILAQQRNDGRAMVLATHQLDDVLDWCDRVVILNRGRVVEESSPGGRDAAGWASHLAQLAQSPPSSARAEVRP